MADEEKKSPKPASAQSAKDSAPELEGYEADELPSIVKRAELAYQEHHRRQESEEQSAANDEQESTDEYQGPSRRQVAKNQNPAMENLIAEIVEQQQRGLHRAQTKGSVKLRRGTLLRLAVLGLMIVATGKMFDRERSRQEDSDKPRSGIRLNARLDDLLAESNLPAIFIRSEASTPDVSTAATAPSRIGLATKSAPTSAVAGAAPGGAQNGEQLLLQAWRSLLNCAGQSPWSGYHSPGFRKITDQLLVLQQGDKLYTFSPYYARAGPIFHGWFWQRAVEPLSTKIGIKMARFYPSQRLVFPFEHLYGNSESARVSGAFYLNLRRGNEAAAQLVYRLGQPVYKTKKSTYRTITGHHLLWARSTDQLSRAGAEALIEEVEGQIERFKSNSSRPWPLMSTSSSVKTAWNIHTDEQLHQCQTAGLVFKSSFIENEALSQRRRLRTDPNALWFPSLIIHAAQLDQGPAPEPYLYSPRYMAASLRTCLLDQRIRAGQAFRVNFTISSNGFVRSSHVAGPSDQLQDINACVQRLTRRINFPSSTTSEPRKDRQLSILYRYQ